LEKKMLKRRSFFSSIVSYFSVSCLSKNKHDFPLPSSRFPSAFQNEFGGLASDPPTINVTDNGDGSYTVGYTAWSFGKYIVKVSLFGKIIKGCPATVTVENYRSSAEFCTASGPGVQGSALAKGEAALKIQAANSGGPVKHGDEKFTVAVTAPNGDEAKVSDVVDNG
jgi:hypothetical protein